MPPIAETPDAAIADPTTSTVPVVEDKLIKAQQPKQLECDFDKDPTSLYLALQKRDWESTVLRANESPEEARTWISRKEKDGKVRWRLLPLHAAIIFDSPESVVEALLEAFPTGAEAKDDQGMLPLHLAFRNGSTEGIVNLLLVAFPQSIDIKDRKGRIPLVLAQASTSPNKDAFMRALERGPTYYAVAAAATERAAVTAELCAIFDARLAEIKNQHQFQVDTMKNDAEAIQTDLEERVEELETELSKTQETSQVLVDHVNSLEAQLSSRSDTERFLATKIASLDACLREVGAAKDEAEASMTTENAELKTCVAALEEKLRISESDDTFASTKLGGAQNRIAVLEAENAQLDKNSSRRIAKLQLDLANSKANGAILEAQLKKKIATEHALTTQVSSLAARLAESAAESSSSTSSYAARTAVLEEERDSLRVTVSQLTFKLKNVGLALDAISIEQDKIVNAAAAHEETMVRAAAAHARIVADAVKQDELFSGANAERQEIFKILNRQRADMETFEKEREMLRGAILVQDEQMAASARECDALIAGVRKQKESVKQLVEEELTVIPEQVENGQDWVEEVMENMKEESARLQSRNAAPPTATDEEEGTGAGDTETEGLEESDKNSRLKSRS